MTDKAVKILVMGLPTSGKSYLSERLKKSLSPYGDVLWLNADTLRMEANDWDFTVEGRLRQAERMSSRAESSKASWVIFDLVAPLPEMRNILKADWVVWLDTVEASPYQDTNFVFQPPESYDFHIVNHDFDVAGIGEKIRTGVRNPVFDPRKPTVQMLGRFQPWHKGHRALFERAIQKTGQVSIMVRDTFGTDAKNPFRFDEVQARIQKDLDPLYQGQFEVCLVPNIVNITYGRDVGYAIDQEHFDLSVESISASNIRNSQERRNK